MPSPGVKAAVSDYEHLNSRHLQKFREVEVINNSSEDDSFLPLKPPKPVAVPSKSFNSDNILTDTNNSSIVDAGIRAQQSLGLTELVNDFGQFQSPSNIPVPTAWSPSMTIKPNPSLFITPQKSQGTEALQKNAKETFLEPQNKNRIPQPMAWSPGMIVRPTPSLFITPEKSFSKNITSNVQQTEQTFKSNIQHSKTLGYQETLTKSKEKFTVRFDLPSASSGDETLDPLSDCESPITLKGSEILSDEQNLQSPAWKTFSPQKLYNPNAYSDESSLEESILGSLPMSKPISVTSNVVKSSFPDFISSSGSTSLSSFKSSLPVTSGQHLKSDSVVKGGTTSLNSQKTQASRSKSTFLSSGKSKSRNPRKESEKPANVKAGPQFIKSAASSSEPPPPGLFVVRESKGNTISTEYSYPFDGEAVMGEFDYEHAFARPEFNSTLKVRSELDNLCQQEVDVKRAVETTLAKSEIKRTELNEKAASCTNRGNDQFKNLVDLDTSVDRLCDRVVRMRTSKVPAKKKEVQIDKKSDGSFKTPDLMEFFAPDLQRESPELSLPGLTSVISQLMTAPHSIAFDLYRHNRTWLGVNDF